MVQSPEYPDLKFVPPKSWTPALRKDIQIVVIHTTEGPERGTSAEDGARYDTEREDGTSAHYHHDQNSTVQCVTTPNISHAARKTGNRIGIHHELSGKAGQGKLGWADQASIDTIQQCAKQVARDCAKWSIPVRRITPGMVANGIKGICGHGDVTIAFPGDHGDHTDPGPDFPWVEFLELVRFYRANPTGEIMTATTPAEFLAILRDPAVAKEMRKIAVSYAGEPLTPGASFVTVVDEIHTATAELVRRPAVVAITATDRDAIVAELTAAVADALPALLAVALSKVEWAPRPNTP